MSLALAGLACGACALESARAGDACRRTTECPAGLACVRSRCTRDLTPVAADNTVPELGAGAEAPEAAAADASAPDAG